VGTVQCNLDLNVQNNENTARKQRVEIPLYRLTAFSVCVSLSGILGTQERIQKA